MFDGTVPLDWRIAPACAAILLAGIAKGVTGMGMPIVGVPILVALYGDLRMVLVVTILSTAVTDIPMVWRYRDRLPDAKMLIGFLIAGAIGIVIGTQVLSIVRTAYLAALLALVVFVFVGVSWLGRVPTVSRAAAARWGPAIGLVCGVLQGSAGAAGPLTSSYLLSVQLSRASLIGVVVSFS